MRRRLDVAERRHPVAAKKSIVGNFDAAAPSNLRDVRAIENTLDRHRGPLSTACCADATSIQGISQAMQCFHSGLLQLLHYRQDVGSKGECRRLVSEFLKLPDLSKNDLDALAIELTALSREATSAVRFLRMQDEWS